LMFWTIVAPEILPAWALNQRLAAMTIRDLYNKEKGVFSYLFPMNGLAKQSKVMSKRNAARGIWKTLKEWFSFYEIKEFASQGGYFEWYLCLGGC